MWVVWCATPVKYKGGDDNGSLNPLSLLLSARTHRPILVATGAEVFTFSNEDPGAGNVVKLAGNFLIASAIESIGEALALAENQGLDRAQVGELAWVLVR